VFSFLVDVFSEVFEEGFGVFEDWGGLVEGFGLGGIGGVVELGEQVLALGVQVGGELEGLCGCQGLAHFLDAEQLGEAGIEQAGLLGIPAPVVRGMEGAGALAGAQAIEGLAAVIAQIFALGMDGASEVGLQILAGLSGEFVMGEVGATLEGEGDAAEAEAFLAVWGEVLFCHCGAVWSLNAKTPHRFR